MSQTLAPTVSNTASKHVISVVNRLFPEPRAFALQLWDGTLLPAQSKATFALVLNTPSVLRHMFSPPIELSLGEAFIRGEFDIEGDIFGACATFKSLAALSLSIPEWVAIARDLFALPRSSPHTQNERGRVSLSGARHSRERDRAAIQYHYDVGNDFYALWLDNNMQYSCGYFPTGRESLDEAQTLKMAHICRKLQLKPGERLLDIGCGWGGLARFAAKNYGVHVVGVTLSAKQMEFANYENARSGLGKQVIVKLQDYRDLTGEPFDKIVSVGMFEHVGHTQLLEYFGHAYRLLKPGGLFLNHGISSRMTRATFDTTGSAACCDPRKPVRREARWQASLNQRILGAGSFIQQYVFPDGELMPVSAINLMAEQAGFEVRDVENLREHYALTLRHWVNRLEARRPEAIARTDQGTYRTWRIYMAASAIGFELGKSNVNQSLLAKLDHGTSHLPLSRAGLYAA